MFGGASSINAQQQNFGGASNMDLSMSSSRTLVGQAVWTYQCPAVWTYQCPAAELWWGKQYGHTDVQNVGGHSGTDRLAASTHGHLLGFDGAEVPADGQMLQMSVLGYL